jgi:hypothetical protein
MSGQNITIVGELPTPQKTVTKKSGGTTKSSSGAAGGSKPRATKDSTSAVHKSNATGASQTQKVAVAIKEERGTQAPPPEETPPIREIPPNTVAVATVSPTNTTAATPDNTDALMADVEETPLEPTDDTPALANTHLNVWYTLNHTYDDVAPSCNCTILLAKDMRDLQIAIARFQSSCKDIRFDEQTTYIPVPAGYEHAALLGYMDGTTDEQKCERAWEMFEATKHVPTLPLWLAIWNDSPTLPFDKYILVRAHRYRTAVRLINRTIASAVETARRSGSLGASAVWNDGSFDLFLLLPDVNDTCVFVHGSTATPGVAPPGFEFVANVSLKQQRTQNKRKTREVGPTGAVRDGSGAILLGSSDEPAHATDDSNQVKRVCVAIES